MRKVEPTIQAFLTCCLICLFAFNMQAQQLNTTSNNPTMSETKKNLADQREVQIDIPQTPTQSFTPTERNATSTQIQQLEVISNTSLTKTPAQKRTSERSSNVVIDYDIETVPMTPQQVRQIRLNDGRDHRTQPPKADLSHLKSAICGAITFDNPTICSVTPVFGDNIDIVVEATSCDFEAEAPNPSDPGTLIVNGLSIAVIGVDPTTMQQDTVFLGTVLESETFGTTACSTMPLMVPPNNGCTQTSTEFLAFTTLFVVDEETGVITAADIDETCPVESFIITINPNLTAQIIGTQDPVCGTLTAALFAEDGTQCGAEITAMCTVNGAAPTITFNYSFPNPEDGNTYQECPSTQTVEGEVCAGCGCGGEVDYEDVTACSVDDGSGVISISSPEVACMISPEIDNGDGTLTVYSFDVYSPDVATGTYIGSLFESATLGAIACNGSLDISYPVNMGCDPLVFQFEVVTAINTVDAASGTIVDFVDDTSCDGTETFSVTLNPTLTAGIVDDQGAACGTLTAALFAADGTACPGTEATAMCTNFGDVPSVTLVDPYGCADPASLTITGAACENCVCGGIVDFEDAVECSADLTGNGALDILFPQLGCNVNPETVNADGSLTVYSLDFYVDDGTGNLVFLGSFFESATFGVEACTGDLTLTNFPINQTCDATVFNFAVITAINTIDADGNVIGFVDDPSCTRELFSATINPTLTAQITADDSADCGSFTAALFAEDGTQCADTEVTSATCNPETGDGMTIEVVLTDPFGCADPASLTISAACDGCFIPMAIADPCNCFPDGVDLDGDGRNDLALETITITGAAAGEGWTVTNVIGLVNPDNTPTTATVMDNNDGTYTYTSYIAADGVTTYSATFTNAAGDMVSISGGQCPSCPPPLDEVPTVGEWGLIMLGLLMTITAVIGIRQRREEETYA